jgi:hypothetical protein
MLRVCERDLGKRTLYKGAESRTRPVIKAILAGEF